VAAKAAKGRKKGMPEGVVGGWMADAVLCVVCDFCGREWGGGVVAAKAAKGRKKGMPEGMVCGWMADTDLCVFCDFCG
jgi:hypothetical protein